MGKTKARLDIVFLDKTNAIDFMNLNPKKPYVIEETNISDSEDPITTTKLTIVYHWERNKRKRVISGDKVDGVFSIKENAKIYRDELESKLNEDSQTWYVYKTLNVAENYTYPIIPEVGAYRKVEWPAKHGRCLWCGTKLKPRSELKDHRNFSNYFCVYDPKIHGKHSCHSWYNSKFNWDWLRSIILHRDGNKCVLCGYEKDLSVDHITAVALGGDYWDPTNLRTLCDSCHKEKSRLDVQKITELRKEPVKPKFIPLLRFLS